MAFTAPHDPRRTHQQWHHRYQPEDIALPPNFGKEHPFDNGHMNGRDERLTARPRDPYQTQCEMADYFAMTEHMDHGIGRIHVLLAELGLEENTLVIHSGDHGLAVGQHGLMGKQNLYDHSTRVPLIIAGPQVPTGVRRDGLCYQHDLFPTLLQTAACDLPAETPFRSLWPLISGQAATNYDAVGCYYEDSQRMVTDGHAKLIKYCVNGQPSQQCFDLDADPWEQIDTNGKPVHPSETCREDIFCQWQETMRDPWRGNQV